MWKTPGALDVLCFLFYFAAALHLMFSFQLYFEQIKTIHSWHHLSDCPLQSYFIEISSRITQHVSQKQSKAQCVHIHFIFYSISRCYACVMTASVVEAEQNRKTRTNTFILCHFIFSLCFRCIFLSLRVENVCLCIFSALRFCHRHWLHRE